MKSLRIVSNIVTLSILGMGIPVSAGADTVVKNFIVIEADPAWAAARSRLGAPPSRIGEVISPGASSIYRVEEITFAGRRQKSGIAEIRLPIRSSEQGLGEILFNGHRDHAGIGEVVFARKPAPGVNGTLRRIGDIHLPGLPTR